MEGAFVDFYQDLLGVRMENICEVKPLIIKECVVLNENQHALLNCNFTVEEVKEVMMSIPNDKSLD